MDQGTPLRPPDPLRPFVKTDNLSLDVLVTFTEAITALKLADHAPEEIRRMENTRDRLKDELALMLNQPILVRPPDETSLAEKIGNEAANIQVITETKPQSKEPIDPDLCLHRRWSMHDVWFCADCGSPIAEDEIPDDMKSIEWKDGTTIVSPHHVKE